jgi:thiamine-phosphate pyrophosphorylase
MIIITSPTEIANEISLIHSLFKEGMALLHIRKPAFSAEELNTFITQIGLEYSKRLVLHSHHHLANALAIHRVHFTENNQKVTTKKQLETYKKQGYTLSASTHCIEDFNELDYAFDYAFLSPVFTSISKENYHPKTDLFDQIKKRTNYKTKLIALSGISVDNIQHTLKSGFDNIALLGTIWTSNSPIENFKSCQQIALSY